MEDYMDEKERLMILTQYERELWGKGIQMIGGMDEVGRGPLAGPVVACCIILPCEMKISGVNDSKKLSPSKRRTLSEILRKNAISIGIGCIDPIEIDEINILNATKKAMCMAIEQMSIKPEYVLIDALEGLNFDIPQIGIIKGDQKSHTIAAASIIAKVFRDHIMEEYDECYPQYGFKRHKGYGTKEHISAIKEYGSCQLHRRTFIRKFV